MLCLWLCVLSCEERDNGDMEYGEPHGAKGRGVTLEAQSCPLQVKTC